MKGYYNKPEETDMILRRHADGQIWAHTGDVGYMDEDGFVYLDSRIKRMIIRHDGFKVFPSMIENVISRHPAVHQCSVVGCTDKDHVQGRLPFVYVVLDPEGDKKSARSCGNCASCAMKSCRSMCSRWATSSSPKCPLPLLARWTTASWKKKSLPAITDPELHSVIFSDTELSRKGELFVWKKPQNTDAAMTAIF